MKATSAMCGFVAACAIVVGACGSESKPAPSSPATPHAAIHDFEVRTIDGETIRLEKYAGNVLLIVNVASRCGFTPQYAGLEALYQKYKNDGLVLLGFPCDQFGNQEPGTEAEIKSFCALNYSVTFPMFSKIEVNGPNAHPLYRFLRNEQKGAFDKNMPGAEKLYAHLEKTRPETLGTDDVKWNFTKFLVDRSGRVVKRFESMETPEAIEPYVVQALHAR